MRGVEAQVREAVGDELAGMWAANRRRKLAELESIYEDVEREIQDAGLTRAARNKNRNLLASFIHDMNEITGHLSVRTTVQVKSGARCSVTQFLVRTWERVGAPCSLVRP